MSINQDFRTKNRPLIKNGFPVAKVWCRNHGMIYGYARVSTDGQSVEAQAKQLRAAGAEKLFKETASGTKTDRAQLRRALKEIDKGDKCLIVTRPDRLARSTRDLLNTLAQIADKRAAFRSLADAWADTTTPHGHLMLTVLGGLAEFERELNPRPHQRRPRTCGGAWRAYGRPSKLTLHQKKEAIKRRDAGEPTREIARMFNVSHSTIFAARAMTAVELHRIDPTQNMRRFYRLDMQPDLFGGVLLVRQWGRIGAEGRSAPEHS